MTRKSFRYEKTSTTETWSQGTCRRRICTQTWVLSTLQCVKHCAVMQDDFLNKNSKKLKSIACEKRHESERDVRKKIRNWISSWASEVILVTSTRRPTLRKFRSVVGLRFLSSKFWLQSWCHESEFDSISLQSLKRILFTWAPVFVWDFCLQSLSHLDKPSVLFVLVYICVDYVLRLQIKFCCWKTLTKERLDKKLAKDVTRGILAIEGDRNSTIEKFGTFSERDFRRFGFFIDYKSYQVSRSGLCYSNRTKTLETGVTCGTGTIRSDRGERGGETRCKRGQERNWAWGCREAVYATRIEWRRWRPESLVARAQFNLTEVSAEATRCKRWQTELSMRQKRLWVPVWKDPAPGILDTRVLNFLSPDICHHSLKPSRHRRINRFSTVMTESTRLTRIPFVTKESRRQNGRQPLLVRPFSRNLVKI